MIASNRANRRKDGWRCSVLPEGTTARALRFLGGIAIASLLLPLVSNRLQAQLVPTTGRAFSEAEADTIFEHLNENNGLSSPVVTSFAEDGDGFLWVGTQSGLQRWDGYRLWTYKTQMGVADSLPDNFTQVLYTDSRGRLWVGTSSGGLARYDRQNDRFVRLRATTGGAVPVEVEAIQDDGRGGLWVGSGTGLDHLDGTTNTFTHMIPAARDGHPLPSVAVSSLLRTADGALWIGTARGLRRSAAGERQGIEFQSVTLPASDSSPAAITALFVDRTGVLWVGTEHGLSLIDAASFNSGSTQFETLSVPTAGAEKVSLATERILSISANTKGEIWVGTQEHGVLVVDPTTWEVHRLAHDPALPTSLSDDWVQTLYLGRQGIMWVGSRHGVSYLDTARKAVLTLQGGSAVGQSIHDADVYAVLARVDGSIWLGLSKHGIDILDNSGHRTGELRTASAGTNDTLPEGTVGCLAEAGHGDVYIVTQHGLYLAHTGPSQGATPRLSRVPIGNDASDGLFQVLLDHDSAGREVLWLGGSNGLWSYDPGASGPAVRARMQKPLTDQRIRVLHRGPDNALWIGTLNGLNRLDVSTGEVETIFPDPADPDALGAAMISTLLTDRRGRLWVGTFTGGINMLEGHDIHGKARFHRISEGLPNENVDMMLEAKDGKIWASTDGGLARIDPFTFAIEVLGRAEGAYILTYWDGVGGRTPGGDLFFGGSGGLTVVRPELYKPLAYLPPVVVTSARIGSVDVPLARFNSGPDEYPVWIPADQNNLTVEFAALDYTAPTRIRYEYKLEGFDHDWIAVDPTRRIARYTNLPPGRYTLLLRGSNRDGFWSPARRVRILVLPKWYQKAWFGVLVFLLGLLALVGVFLLATAYLRRRQRELERQVALRTAELQQRTVELKESRQKLEHMAYTDSLTGLPNRRMFTEHFRRLLALKRREQNTFALLLMDFDEFKAINDTYGHDAGDAVLKEMARRMGALVRESDCLARLGGDEFGLLLGQSPDIEATEMVCRKIVDSFGAPVLFEGVELRTAPSIGVALYPDDGKTQDRLYKMADMAMYEAKRNGGNGCRWRDGRESLSRVR